MCSEESRGTVSKKQPKTGSLATNLHEGSRSEYLAVYVFTSFGTVVSVPHQEDTGIDLYCTITKRIGKRSFPREYFSVQVKSYTKKDEAWVVDGKDSVRWFIEHPLPLFLCQVEKSTLTLRVYHTFPRYGLWASGSPPDHVELTRGTESDSNCWVWSESGSMSLGKPILELDVRKLVNNKLKYSLQDVLAS